MIHPLMLCQLWKLSTVGWDDRINIYGELGTAEEVTVAYFNVLLCNLHGKTQETCQDGWAFVET